MTAPTDFILNECTMEPLTGLAFGVSGQNSEGETDFKVYSPSGNMIGYYLKSLDTFAPIREYKTRFSYELLKQCGLIEEANK